MCTCVLRLGCFLLACLVLYFVPPFSFQPFLMFTSEFNERSRSNPLCDFRLGTVVTSDYETPLTVSLAPGIFCAVIMLRRMPMASFRCAMHGHWQLEASDAVGLPGTLYSLINLPSRTLGVRLLLCLKAVLQRRTVARCTLQRCSFPRAAGHGGSKRFPSSAPRSESSSSFCAFQFRTFPATIITLHDSTFKINYGHHIPQRGVFAINYLGYMIIWVA